MTLDTADLVALSLTGWGVMFSVSFGWSFYSLMDQYPRLVRFGSIWSKKNHDFRKTMLVGWFATVLLGFLSIMSLISGAFRFSYAGWNCTGDGYGLLFFAAYSLLGMAAFLVPFFINRAVWSLTLYLAPKASAEFLNEDENGKNKIYWDRRFTSETAYKLHKEPKKAGAWVLSESFVIFVVLCTAISGWHLILLDDPGTIYWFFSPLSALVFSWLAHLRWPDWIPSKNEKG